MVEIGFKQAYSRSEDKTRLYIQLS